MKWYQRSWCLASFVAAVAVAVYLPSIVGGWIYDDHFLIPGNSYVHTFSWWPRWFVTDFWAIGEEYVQLGSRIAYWRPSITATYALDWRVGGGTPLVFHITNLLWQAGVGALTFLVLRRWIGTLWPALLAALLFVVHPTKAESVAWIAGRTDVICMAAVLLASQGLARRLRGEKGGLVLEMLATLFAYTTKEQAIILPAFAVVEGWVALGRPAIDLKSSLKMLRIAAPQIGIAVCYLALRKVLMPLQAPGEHGAGMPFIDHVLVVFDSLGRYAALALAPFQLSIQHGLVRMTGGVPQHSIGYVVLGVITLIALVATAYLLRKRLPAVTLGLAFFFVTLMPTMNIIYAHMETLVSERFLYLPFLGISLALGGVLVEWPRRWLYGAVAAAVVYCSVLSIDRSADYQDENRFWARELAIHPDSSEARRARSRLAIRERRYFAALVDTLELTRKANGGQDVSVAVISAQLLADLTPDHDRVALETIDGFCRDMLDRVPMATIELRGLRFAIPTTTKVYELNMKYYELRLLSLRSNIYSRLGDDARAIELANQALAKCPRCLTTVVASALALARAGSYEDAFAVLDSAQGYIAEQYMEPIRTMIEKSHGEYQRSLAVTGPAQLQARAAALSALELWGRAYDILAPYTDQIKRAPKFVRGFAELAVRAGEPQVAREVLAGTMEPAEMEQAIAEWTRKMGWAQ